MKSFDSIGGIRDFHENRRCGLLFCSSSLPPHAHGDEALMSNPKQRSGDRRVHLVFGSVAAVLSASIPLVAVQGYAAVTWIVLFVVTLLWLIYVLRR